MKDKRIAHNKFTKEKEGQIIEEYNKLGTGRKVAESLGISKTSVYRVLRDNSLKVATFSEMMDISEDLKDTICELYLEKHATYSISRKLKINKKRIYKVLKEKNIQKIKYNLDVYRKYKLEDNYFENINTEAKAYYLGLLVADGCVRENGITTISLQEKDVDILYSFKEELKYTGPILYINTPNPKHSNVRNLSFSSKKISKDLIGYGLIQNKTYSTYFPNIPKEFWPHFIRGVFDGDGCICYTGGKYYFNIAGNDILVKRIQEILMQECNLSETNIRHPKKNSPTVSIMLYSGNRQLKRIREYLYRDAHFYIQRKYDKFHEMTVTWTT